MGRNSRGIIVYILIVLAIFGLVYWMTSSNAPAETYTYKEFEKDLDAGTISAITIKQNSEIPTGIVMIRFKDSSTSQLFVEDVGTITAELQERDLEYTLNDVTREGFFTSTILPMLIMLVIMTIFFSIISRNAGGAGGNVMSFGKSRAKAAMATDNKTTFQDVAGLTEEKSELEEVVDFLKNPQKYTKVGARIPKGMILVGPPGTGKTLLARAVSGEAGVPFFHISGSDFVEMFVGVGASRVRDLFGEAKKNAPCIIFIDEIDAVARRRGSGLGGGHDER